MTRLILVVAFVFCGACGDDTKTPIADAKIKVEAVQTKEAGPVEAGKSETSVKEAAVVVDVAKVQ